MHNKSKGRNLKFKNDVYPQSNFEDPAGACAILEGANLRGANLENSVMAGNQGFWVNHRQN